MIRAPLLLLATSLLALVAPGHCDLMRGLAWGTDDRWANQDFGPLLTWYHHWADPQVEGLDKAGYHYLPMLWGEARLDQWYQVKKTFSNNPPSHVLAMNEPDCEGQATSSPQAAAALWRRELAPLAAKGIQVSTPQLCWNLDWLKQFKKACSDCDIGFVAAHYYGQSTDQSKLQTYVESLQQIYPGKEVWITELGLANKAGADQGQVNSFMQQAVAWMQSSGSVARVAWTGCFAINSPPDGFLTALGAFFNPDGSMRSTMRWMANEQGAGGLVKSLKNKGGKSRATALGNNKTAVRAKGGKNHGKKHEAGRKESHKSVHKPKHHKHGKQAGAATSH